MRPSTESALRAEINVTPLVDVCLVLLIIFMVVTPMLRRAEVALPETLRPDRMPEKRTQLTISIGREGMVRLGALYVPAEGLPAALRQVYAHALDREIAIQGDYRLPYKEVRKVMELVQAARFTRVGLVTEKKKP
jgi:biopolymer transport protein TolR